MSTGYEVLFVLHVLCVIGGFGGVAYNGLYLAVAARRGPDALAIVEANRQVTGLAELLVYGAFVFGIATAGQSRHQVFGQAWVIAAIAIFAVLLGLLHGVVRPAQRRWQEVATELTTVEVLHGGVVPPQVATLDRLATKVAVGQGAWNVLVVAVVVLMITKPGG